MKKIAFFIALALLLSLALTACGGSAGGQYGSNANYIDVIEAAREAEQNEVFYAVADAATRAGTASSLYGDDSKDEQLHGSVMNEAVGFDEGAMQKYAISLGFSITQAYGVAIILPAEGREQDVIDMVNAYVLAQQKAQENYLPAQYEIAMDAQVKTAPTGEVLLVMCRDAAAVMERLEAGLAA